MSLKTFKYRIKALMLFFIDYKAILLCFTILSLIIPTGNLLERVLFDQEAISFLTILRIFLPSIALGIVGTVSYRLFLHVQVLGTFLKIFLISAIFVFFFGYAKYQKISEEIVNVQSFTGKNVWITGVVTSQEGASSYLFHPEVKGVGNSLVRFRQRTDLHVGQRCKFKGKVVQPKSFAQFDYRKYLFRRRIYSILEIEQYECSDWGNTALEVRYRLEGVVERALGEPEASLLIGIMFGSKRIFTDDFNEALNNSGVSHIVAASGYNVALVANGIDLLTRKYSGKWVVILKILCIWLFSVFSGLSSSLVRAATMTTLYLFALLLGREVNRGVSLLFCITLLILFNPFLLHDIGFLFSSLSTTGLIFFSGCFKEIKSTVLKDSVLPTLTCILFTLPISVMFFGKVSAVSLLSNIVVVPIVNSTIFWGLGITLINIFFPLRVLYLIPYLQLSIFKYFVLISSNMEMVEVGLNKNLLAVCIYTGLFLFCLLKYPLSLNNWYMKEAKNGK